MPEERMPEYVSHSMPEHMSFSFPECVARVPVSLCSLDVAQPSPTVRNRPRDPHMALHLSFYLEYILTFYLTFYFAC